MASSLSRVRRRVNCRAHLLESAAAADICDRAVNVRITRLWLFHQQCYCSHDHAGLAVPTLWHVVLKPGFLNGMQNTILSQPFDRSDLLPFSLADRKGAGADSSAVDVHGAGSALRNSATVFGPGEADLLP